MGKKNFYLCINVINEYMVMSIKDCKNFNKMSKESVLLFVMNTILLFTHTQSIS